MNKHKKTLLLEIYRQAKLIKQTDLYDEYAYRSLILKLYYGRDNIVYMIKGTN